MILKLRQIGRYFLAKEILPGGDHDIFIGEIVAGKSTEGQPLLYYQGKYTRLVPPADDA